MPPMTQMRHDIGKPLVLITGSFRFPDGDAAAARVFGIGCALRDAGYDVVFGGGESRERVEDKPPSGMAVYKGFAYQSLGGLDRQGNRGVQRFLDLQSRTEKLTHWLASYQQRGIAAVLTYGPNTGNWIATRRFTRKHGIPLIVDLTEWQTGANLRGGKFGFRYLDLEMRMRLLYPDADAVIPISSYIEAYYQKRGLRTLRVPPLMDLQEPKWNLEQWAPSENLRLVYAGSPANKDMLGAMIRAVVTGPRRARRLELHILGPNAEEARALAGCELQSENAAVICYGRIPQNDVPRVVAGMDFTVLLRKDDRNANAGFSTKLAEGLCCGVPAIVNVTSDIAEYITHGREGLLVTGDSAEAFSAALDEAAEITPASLAQMRSHAKDRAQKTFDYRNYREQLRTLIESVANQPLIKNSVNAAL